MHQVTLHRAYGSWRIGDLPLLTTRRPDGAWMVWAISTSQTMPRRVPDAWLKRHGITHDTCFETRRDVVRTMTALLAADPLRESALPPRWRRQTNGTYRSVPAGMTAHRHSPEAFFVVYDGDPTHHLVDARSLNELGHQVKWRAEQRAKRSDNVRRA